MTEAEWLTCTDPTLMLKGLYLVKRRRPKRPSHRKLRLFGVACCRRIWHLLANGQVRNALETAELYADGLSSEINVEAARLELVNITEFGDETSAVNWTLWMPKMSWMESEEAARATARYAAKATGQKDEPRQQCKLLRDILGPFPFRSISVDPCYLTQNVVALAKAIYEERAFERLPILADALEDAGCDNADILNHCREPGVHVRGCWVVDLLLEKE